MPYTTSSITVGGTGPNAEYKWVSAVLYQVVTPPVTPRFDYAVHTRLVNTLSTFFMAQNGTYSAGLDISPACSSTNETEIATAGFIDGPALLANGLRHEAGDTASHYQQYVSTFASASTNVGTLAEAMIGAAAVSQSTFTIGVDNALDMAQQGNAMAIASQPCGSPSITFDATCTCNGYVNFDFIP